MTDQAQVDNLTDEERVVAATIAQRLDESKPIALRQIERIVQRLGGSQALALLEETLTIEAGEGLLTSDKQTRRTPGGVYLYLAKGRVSPEDRKFIWPARPSKKKKAGGAAQKPAVPPMEWDERLVIIPDLLRKKGFATTVKITLIGRPGKIVEKGEVVLTSMQSTKMPALPKGLPMPPAEPTTYVVYIARKQWNRVRETIQNPQDALIIEGFPVFDKRLNVMAVFATNTTTKLLEQARRETQRSKP